MEKMKVKTRNYKWQDTRLNWEEHVDKLRHTNSFAQKYRMSYDAFNKLLGILRPFITVNAIKSMNSCPESSGPIYPELIMAMGI